MKRFGKSCRTVLAFLPAAAFSILMLLPASADDTPGIDITAPPDAPPAETRIIIPVELYINNRPAGFVDIDLTGSDPVIADPASLSESLESYLELNARRTLDRVLGQALLPADALITAGIESEFDYSLLRLSLYIPPALRKAFPVYLSGRSRTPEGVFISPDPFSAYMNIRFRGEYEVQKFENGESERNFPLVLSLQPVFNFSSWVLESGITFSNTPESTAAIDSLRLVKDFPQAAIRFSGGTFSPPRTGFMNPSSLLGIGISRTRSQPMLGSRNPLYGETLVLENPARVSIYMNERLIKTELLDAGRHDLLDFPYLSGLNDIRMVITEDGGEPEIISRIVPFDSLSLDPGESVFSLSAGFRNFFWEKPASEDLIFSAYYNRGFNFYATGGGYLQSGGERTLGGLEGLFLLPFGSLGLNLGGSMKYSSSPDTDFGGEIRYRIAFPGRRTLPVIGLGAVYTGRDFLGPAADLDHNTYKWQFSSSYSQTLPFGAGLGISAGYRSGWSPSDEDIAASVTVLKTLAQGFTISFSGRADFPLQGGSPGYSGTFTFSSTPPGERHTLSYSQSMKTGNTGINLQVRPVSRFNSPSWSAAVRGDPFDGDSPVNISAGSRITTRTFEVSASETLTWGGEGSSLYLNRFTLQAASSLVYAGGSFAVTTPVSDSFVIIIPDKTKTPSRLIINPEGDSFAAVSKGRPAALSGITSYRPSTIIIESPDVPAGYDTSTYRQIVLPGYRSGTVIRAKSEVSVFAEGVILLPDGSPAVYMAGEARPLDRSAVPDAAPGTLPLLFFTDERGSFELYGLKPGSWEISLYSGTAARAGVFSGSISIPEGTEGLFSAGEITISRGNGQIKEN